MFIEEVFARTAKRDRVKVGEFHLEGDSVVLKKNPINMKEHFHNNFKSIGTDVAILNRLGSLRMEHEVTEARISVELQGDTYWASLEQYHGKGSMKNNHDYGYEPQRFLPINKWKNPKQPTLF